MFQEFSFLLPCCQEHANQAIDALSRQLKEMIVKLKEISRLQGKITEHFRVDSMQLLKHQMNGGSKFCPKRLSIAQCFNSGGQILALELLVVQARRDLWSVTPTP